MQPNVLLMCKLVLLLLLLHNISDKFGDPYLPFIGLIDGFRELPGWYGGIQHILFWISGAALLLNIKVRTAALGLGICVLMIMLGSKPLFQNHVFIVSCIFLLAGLSRKEDGPVLFQYQFAIIYFGAFLNKAMQLDWWTGDFLHTWLHLHLQNSFYETLSPLLPELWFASIVSALVMFLELLLAVLFIVKRWNGLAISVAVVMHLSFLFLIRGPHFGYFTEDILLALLAFLHWPDKTIYLRLHKALQKPLKPLIPLINPDRQFEFEKHHPGSGRWMEIQLGEVRYFNTPALAVFLKYHPFTYLSLFLGFKAMLFIAQIT